MVRAKIEQLDPELQQLVAELSGKLVHSEESDDSDILNGCRKSIDPKSLLQT